MRSMIQSISSINLVLINRNFREDDKIVKIFTEQGLANACFLSHAGLSQLAPVLFSPWCWHDFSCESMMTDSVKSK